MRPSSLLGILFILVFSAACDAPPSEKQPFNAAAIAAEIEAQLRAEIASFEAKDCVTAVGFYRDQEPLFVVSGMTRARLSDVQVACPQLVARIPDGASRPVASEQVYALGPNSGYSVTEFRLRMGPGGAPVPQFVTKIWQKDESGWRIVHVHESVARPSP